MATIITYETRREEGYDLDNPYSVRFEVEEQNTNAISQRNNTKFLESFQVHTSDYLQIQTSFLMVVHY